MSFKIFVFIVLSLALMSSCTFQEVQEIDNITKDDYTIKILNNELYHPWGISFVDENLILITEKDGSLLLFNKESLDIEKISGVPSVIDSGQGGLLDVEYFDGVVYLTYVYGNSEGTGTHLGKGLLNIETLSLDEFKVLYEAKPFMQSGAHFGSRVVVKDDYLFLSTGDRGQKNFGADHISQDISNPYGSIIRLYLNGSIPQDNPFVGVDALDEIYSYGHRNIQGLTIHPITGDLWASEHGEQDGDEINIIQKGKNHGWPIAHYGCTYGTGAPIGDLPHENLDTVNPVYYWECGSGGFPPAGMTFYSGKKFPEWEGNLFLGNLAGQYLGRFEVNGEVKEMNPLLEDQNWRIRDVKESPNGYLYVITDANPGLLIRIEPSS